MPAPKLSSQVAKALRLTTEERSPCPVPFPSSPLSLEIRAHEPTLGTRPLWLPQPTPNSKGSRYSRGKRRLGILLYKWDLGTKCELYPQGDSRPFPPAARPGALSPGGGGRGPGGRAVRSGGLRAGLGARGLPRRAGRWRVGQWLLQPGSCCSRSGGCDGPAGAVLSSAQTLPRDLLQHRRRPRTVRVWRARGWSCRPRPQR